MARVLREVGEEIAAERAAGDLQMVPSCDPSHLYSSAEHQSGHTVSHLMLGKVPPKWSRQKQSLELPQIWCSHQLEEKASEFTGPWVEYSEGYLLSSGKISSRLKAPLVLLKKV